MIYIVKEAFEFEGKTYLPGQIIKLTKQQLSSLKDKVQKAGIVRK